MILVSFLSCVLITFACAQNSPGDQKLKNSRNELDSLKGQGKFYSPEILVFAVLLKNTMEKTGDLWSYDQFTTIKSELPSSVQSIVWDDTSNIASVYFGQFFYAAVNDYAFDTERRNVFLWMQPDWQNKIKQSNWKFVPVEGGQYFMIINEEFNEHLYAADNHYEPKTTQRQIFTWRSDTPHDDSGLWKIEILNDRDVRFKNKKYGEYLYASDVMYDQYRRHVLTWKNGEMQTMSKYVWKIY